LLQPSRRDVKFKLNITTLGNVLNVLENETYFLAYGARISASTSGSGKLFLAYGTRISASTSGAGKCHLTPHVRRVACDDVTISRALLLYKIAFILLGSSLKQ